MKRLLLLTALPLNAAVVHVEMPVPAREQDYFGMCRCAERREFDFDGNGVADLTFTGTDYGDQMISVTSSRVYIQDTTFSLPGVDVPWLNSGMLIGAGSEFGENSAGLLYSWGEGGRMGWHRRDMILQLENYRWGFWPSPSPYIIYGVSERLAGGPWSWGGSYLGFQFQDDNGQSHFGWMMLSYYQGNVEFHEWAYETEPNTPIRAGQVPEPGVAAFCAVGLLLSHKRTRKPNP